MRQQFLPLTLALGLCVSWSAAQAAQDDATRSPGSEEEAEIPEQVAPVATNARPAVRARPERKRRRSRIRWIRKPGKPMGHVVAEADLRAEPPPRPSGNLHLYSIAEKENLKINIYNEDGSYNDDAIRQVSHLLRCKRTEDEKPIEPRLMTVLSHVYDHFGKPLEVVSGYRNQRRQTSFHYQGSAADIRIPGVNVRKIQRYVDSLDAGGMGVGLYPRVGFVHVDIRPLPSYRWIDNSRSNPDSPDKRPPRGWKKRRKLRS